MTEIKDLVDAGVLTVEEIPGYINYSIAHRVRVFDKENDIMYYCGEFIQFGFGRAKAGRIITNGNGYTFLYKEHLDKHGVYPEEAIIKLNYNSNYIMMRCMNWGTGEKIELLCPGYYEGDIYKVKGIKNNVVLTYKDFAWKLHDVKKNVWFFVAKHAKKEFKSKGDIYQKQK